MTTWQFMWRLCTYRPVHYLANIIGWGIFHSLPLLSGLITKAIFDALSRSANAGWNVWTLFAFMALNSLTRTGLFVVSFKAFSSYYLMAEALLRHNLLQYLMQAAKARVMPTAPSEALTQFRDDVEDIAKYIEAWMDLGGLVFFGIGALVILLSINPSITLVACGPMFIMTFIVRRLSPAIRSRRRAMREATAHVTGFIGETTAAVQAVKVAGKEDWMAQRFATLGQLRKRAALRDTLLTELLSSITSNLVNIGVGAVLIMAADAMRTGRFSVGDFALYINMLPRLTRVLSFVGNVMAQHKRSRVAFDRMLHMLQDSQPEDVVKHTPLYLDGNVPPQQPRAMEYQPLEVLQVKGLSYHYPGSKAGIEDISFTLRQGEFVVVTGRIGAGKTTLLRVLQGLIPANAGKIIWNGLQVTDPASHFQPPHSAYTAQVPRLFSDTLRENILLGATAGTANGVYSGELSDGGARSIQADILPDALERAVDLAVLRQDVGDLEKGLDTLVGTRGVKLSGGQLQRAAAARMFAREADLMIFDDLSSALDVQTEQLLWESLFKERDVTCLVVSHRLEALRRATRIIVLEEGRIVAQGSPADLFASGIIGAKIAAIDEGA